MPGGWNIFRGARKKQGLQALRLKIEKFRGLLSENNRALDLLADAEEKLGGDFVFDSQFILNLARELDDSVGKVVHDLNFITNNRYTALVDAYEQVRLKVGDVLASRITVPETPYVLDLSEITSDLTDAVGEKMARLAQIRNRLNVQTPNGFAITSHACKRLFYKIKLADQIRLITEDQGRFSPPEVEARLAGLVAAAEVPRDIRKAIKRALSSLEKKPGKEGLLAVRSSALGEDGELSFAGLHESMLGVRPADVLGAYKEVVASLFNSRAVAYRRSRGEPLDSAIMAVGCLNMVGAVSSGVAYTLDPNDPAGDALLVSAIPGLGKLAVEGEASLDRFKISRTHPHRVLEREIVDKDQMYVIGPQGGAVLVPTPDDRRRAPSVSDEFLANLAAVALRIEQFLKTALDIEWAQDENGDLVLLQARPLQILADSTDIGRNLPQAVLKHRVYIANHGTVTCRGIGYGRVKLLAGKETYTDVPENSVIVAHHSSPHLAEFVPRAAAVITDIGAPTGHLATITRELRVPSIMDVGIATSVLKDGMEVTVDAEENVIYEGKVEELLLYQLLKKSSYQDTAEFRLLRRILKNMTPLNLRNPRDKNFSARHCQTYHDIIRFAHEMAVESLAGGHEVGSDRNTPYSRRVIMDVPLDLMVIDIGGGELLGQCGAECGIQEIACEPLRRLLEGITAPGAWSNEPTDMDFGSFMSSVTGPSVLQTAQTSIPERNLAIISEHYLNLNLHLGYHINQVDAYVSDARNDNYIYFRFIGGMTSITRRSRRAKMISIILEKHDFVVDTLGDFIVARLKKFERPIMLERLKVVGCLIGYARQMDVRMKSDAMIDDGVEKFMRSIYNGYNFQEGGEMAKAVSVLVLDDEAIVCERLKEFLEDKGLEVETFTESQKAIARLDEKNFNVVVTDLKMAGPTGMDVLRFIRDKMPSTKGIVITAYGQSENYREAQVLDAFEIVHKPFQMADLYKLIKTAAKRA